MVSAKRSATALLLTGVFVFSAIMAAFPMETEGQISIRPTLTISPLNPSPIEVVVTPSSIGSASFSADVTVTKPPAVGIVIVNLAATTSSGWPTTVSPQTLPFNTPGRIQITITIVVPQATAATNVGEVTVNGIMTYPGGSEVANTQGVVTVRQYYRLAPRSEQAFTQFSPGAATALQLDVDNRGNGLDTYSIEIVNLKELQKKNWIVTTSRVTMDNVPPDEFDTVKITVQSPRPPIEYEFGETVSIQVRLSSDNAKAMAAEGATPIQKDFIFTIFEKGFYIPGYEPAVVMIALIVISAIVYQRRLDNELEFKDNGK